MQKTAWRGAAFARVRRYTDIFVISSVSPKNVASGRLPGMTQRDVSTTCIDRHLTIELHHAGTVRASRPASHAVWTNSAIGSRSAWLCHYKPKRLPSRGS